ncbi:MAG: hypothetical protein KA290_10670 [Chitinophagaceae bacterium]|nr:hypothetical protein [Chitinophagaceae bacterium]
MLDVVSVYNDITKDSANTPQNGDLSYEMFNRMSKRAELRLIDWLSGSVSNDRLPIPYVTQKNKDWLSPFIKKYETQVVNGRITRPSDYYMYENFFRLGSKVADNCDDDEDVLDDCNTPITILDGDEFNDRCKSNVEEIKPSINIPIAKLVGNEFELGPKDLGSVTLEYIRYPEYASIIPRMDEVYNEEVPDVVTDYEWNENSREILIWFIVDTYANHTREQALKQFNAASNPKG